MYSEDTGKFAARLQNQLLQRQVRVEQAEPLPSKDGIDVCEHQSFVTLSEEDQKLLMALRQRHEMHRERTQTLPTIDEDTAYETIRVKQIVVPGI